MSISILQEQKCKKLCQQLFLAEMSIWYFWAYASVRKMTGKQKEMNIWHFDHQQSNTYGKHLAKFW